MGTFGDVVVLAAGRGTRLRTDSPKPLLPLAGEPLIAHVLSAAAALRPQRIIVVVPPDAAAASAIKTAARARFPAAEFAVQKQPRGTADAAKCGAQLLNNNGAALVLCADAPLILPATLRRLCKAAAARLALLTFRADNPAGYGRIARDSESESIRETIREQKNANIKNNTVRKTLLNRKNAADKIVAIVEDRDARGAMRDVCEVFAGALAAPAAWLKKNLGDIRPQKNNKGEMYLTDLAAMAFAQNNAAESIAAEESEAAGINTLAELAAAESVLRERRTKKLQAKGVLLVDPRRVDLRGKVRAARDSEIDANVILQNTSLGRGAKIGANCVLINCKIGANAVIEPFCHLQGADIGARCVVGPFARIRPQTRIHSDAKIGNFVEIKNATLGAKVKAGHLAYLGDADIGANANIGAGVITCNYDGKQKYKTIIGADSFVGSDSQLVAPVRIGRGAYIAAGTTLTKNAPADALTWSRTAQSSRPKKI